MRYEDKNFLFRNHVYHRCILHRSTSLVKITIKNDLSNTVYNLGIHSDRVPHKILQKLFEDANMMRPTQNDYDMVIVGMGPAGLAAALNAARSGKTVMLLEKRAEKDVALRPQMIVLDTEVKLSLLKMIQENETLNVDDIKFLDTLSQSNEVKVGTVQKFLLNRIKNIQPAVKMCYGTSLETVDMNQGQAQIKQGSTSTQVNFKCLVAADGVKSDTFELVKKELPSRTIEKYTPFLMEKAKNTYHLGVYVKLSRADGKPITLPKNEFVSASMPEPGRKGHRLYFLRFNKRSHKRMNQMSTSMGFIGEIPKSVYQEYNKFNDSITKLKKTLDEHQQIIKQLESQNSTVDIDKKIAHSKKVCTVYNTHINNALQEQRKYALQYVQKVSAHYFGVKPEDLKLEVTTSKKSPNKDKLKVLTFQGDSQQATKAALQVNSHGFYLIGDTYFTPNYPAGHGLNDALKISAAFGQSLVLPTSANDKEGVVKLETHMNNYHNQAKDNATNAKNIMRGLRLATLTQRTTEGVAGLLEEVVAQSKHQFKFGTTLMEKNIINCIITTFRDNLTPDNISQQHINDCLKFLKDCPEVVEAYKMEIYNCLRITKNSWDNFPKNSSATPLTLNQVSYKADLNTAYQQIWNVVKSKNDVIEKINKANVNAIDADGKTPIEYNINNLSTISYFFNLGANPFLKPTPSDTLIKDKNNIATGYIPSHDSPYNRIVSQGTLADEKLRSFLFVAQCCIEFNSPNGLFIKTIIEGSLNFMDTFRVIDAFFRADERALSIYGIDLTYLNNMLQKLDPTKYQVIDDFDTAKTALRDYLIHKVLFPHLDKLGIVNNEFMQQKNIMEKMLLQSNKNKVKMNATTAPSASNTSTTTATITPSQPTSTTSPVTSNTATPSVNNIYATTTTSTTTNLQPTAVNSPVDNTTLLRTTTPPSSSSSSKPAWALDVRSVTLPNTQSISNQPTSMTTPGVPPTRAETASSNMASGPTLFASSQTQSSGRRGGIKRSVAPVMPQSWHATKETITSIAGSSGDYSLPVILGQIEALYNTNSSAFIQQLKDALGGSNNPHIVSTSNSPNLFLDLLKHPSIKNNNDAKNKLTASLTKFLAAHEENAQPKPDQPKPC